MSSESGACMTVFFGPFSAAPVVIIDFVVEPIWYCCYAFACRDSICGHPGRHSHGSVIQATDQRLSGTPCTYSSRKMVRPAYLPGVAIFIDFAVC